MLGSHWLSYKFFFFFWKAGNNLKQELNFPLFCSSSLLQENTTSHQTIDRDSMEKRSLTVLIKNEAKDLKNFGDRGDVFLLIHTKSESKIVLLFIQNDF